MVMHKQQGAQLVLVLGGARSGKSTFAEQLAAKSNRAVVYIATAQASDDDMRDRIARHRAARPSDWFTLEEPLHIADAIHRATECGDVIILDCATTWLSNWLFAREDGVHLDEATITAQHYAGALAEIDALVQTLTTLSAHKTIIVVSNEVGSGIVPAYALGRVYRDVLGLVNQRLARAAQRVYLMIAGLGVDIKRLHEEALRSSEV
jgi:adenosylcobinamide kinase/adenosylcobinamide-phosphate guanylyltransferase